MCAEGFQGAAFSTQPHLVALPELISPVGVENDPIEGGSTGLLHPKVTNAPLSVLRTLPTP